MPASTLDPVSAALRTALSQPGSPLDAQLAGATKKALLTEVEIEPAGTYQSAVLDKIKAKSYVLKSAETPQASKPDGEGAPDETRKLPSRELYPLEAVQLGWSKSEWSVGAGMINMGNTCYLNSTLQALFHVPALVNWLMADKEHAAECQDSVGSCIICAMRKTLQDSQQRNSTTIRPHHIFSKLRLLCRNLIPGGQEDAHEFLRYLVEAMEKSYLHRFKDHSNLDVKVKETTPLNQILGGYLRSAVRCLKCGHVSTTFEHFQDLLLDIRKAQTLDDALDSYFSREKLDDGSYQCESCQKKVPATKQFSLERAPMVLCIQLKRFSVSNNKITKHINFRQRLDLTRYARHRPSVPLIYRLVALVTHMGPSVNCGHYTAVAQAPTGSFYQFDDSMVRVISHQAVFSTNAYIMLYELESSPFTQKPNGTPTKLKILHEPPIVQNGINGGGSPAKPTDGGSSPAKPTNGVGFTSDKVYGPELPPARADQPANGTVAPSNGNGRADSSGSGDDSPKPRTPTKSMQFGAKNGRSMPALSNGAAHEARPLVPYEADDSDESSQSPNEAESRVSTKAAVGEWKVTPTGRAGPGKGWFDRKRADGTVGELNRMSHGGYAAPVATWSGARSQLEAEVGMDRHQERKRALSDDADQGRVKHPKLTSNLHRNAGYNPVQEFHNAKNWNQNGGSTYYKNFKRKRFHNNIKFHKGNRHRP